MSKIIETGHAKNVGNFDLLTSICTGYGARYNPNKPIIQLSALLAKHTDAVKALEVVNSQYASWQTEVNAREIIFEPLKSVLITRIEGAVAASDVDQQFIDDITTVARKLKGKRAKPKKDPPANPAEDTPKNISVSQLSFDSKVDNVSKLIELLKSKRAYAPNEADISVAALTALYNAMRTSNKAVKDAYTALTNSRIARKEVLYNPKTGLVQVAKEVKKYTISVFNSTSAE